LLNLKGYISSREMRDNVIVDQSIQNLVIRKSCENKNFNFILSATEYGMKNCYLMLNQLFVDLKKNKFDGIAFYSIQQLPKEINFKRKIYKTVYKNKKKLFFAIEDILIKNKKDIFYLENLIKIQSLLKFCPKKIRIK